MAWLLLENTTKFLPHKTIWSAPHEISQTRPLRSKRRQPEEVLNGCVQKKEKLQKICMSGREGAHKNGFALWQTRNFYFLWKRVSCRNAWPHQPTIRSLMNIHKVISSNKVHQSPADICLSRPSWRKIIYASVYVNTHSYYIDKLIPINFKNYLYMGNSVTN